MQSNLVDSLKQGLSLVLTRNIWLGSNLSRPSSRWQLTSEEGQYPEEHEQMTRQTDLEDPPEHTLSLSTIVLASPFDNPRKRLAQNSDIQISEIRGGNLNSV